ncbi:Uncharacterised protein [Mycobacteroides abscessus subsp. abscessus]|nr:Uncharacterised protein [Mycobacteroides abscessus subsp. abscessus]
MKLACSYEMFHKSTSESPSLPHCVGCEFRRPPGETGNIVIGKLELAFNPTDYLDAEATGGSCRVSLRGGHL